MPPPLKELPFEPMGYLHNPTDKSENGLVRHEMLYDANTKIRLIPVFVYSVVWHVGLCKLNFNYQPNQQINNGRTEGIKIENM
jgi:hypothetical protein